MEFLGGGLFLHCKAGGVVIYSPGDGTNFFLQGAKDNDRFFLEAKYSF